MKKAILALRGLFLLALVVALGLVPILYFACLTACKPTPVPTVEPTAKPTAAPTAAPTEAPTPEPTAVPTPTPTPEPTETPVPEGWIIDPNGLIPPEVEIIVLPANPGFCLTEIDGQAVLQKWSKNGLEGEWNIPNQLLKGNRTNCSVGTYQREAIIVTGDLTEDMFGPFMFYYQDKEGHTLFFEAGSMCAGHGGVLLATLDGKVIFYIWGNNFYQMHDFGPDEDVQVTENGNLYVNNNKIELQELTVIIHI